MTAQRVSDYGTQKRRVKVFTDASPAGQEVGDFWIYGGSVAIWDGVSWLETGGLHAFFTTGF